MRIVCPDCGAKLDLDEAQVREQGPESLAVRCWMCTRKLVYEDLINADSGPPTVALPSATQERAKASRLDSSLAPETTSLMLPASAAITISVTNGLSRGTDYHLSRPLVTIGRLGGGADFEIDDPEVSRTHCAIEVRQDVILLHDLSSTNGTFIGETRILAGRLRDKSKFRIGSTFLLVNVSSG
jgi:predicted Zn finger-like uncharacterized protein